VQSGGSFDIDYSVVGPTDKVILDGTKERQGDFVFTANDPGEYRFCFNNEMSTFAEKMVDFEIAVRTYISSQVLPVFKKVSLTKYPRWRTRPPAPSSPRNKAPPPNKPPSSKNPSSSFPPSYLPSPETRSTSARARTGTSAPLRAPRDASLLSV
jgi:hypothetical protein